MDSYTVTEAARVIGVSPKRVRQLIAEDRLPTVPEATPVRIPAEPVHREREKRRNVSPSTPGPKPDPEQVTLDLATLLDYARETSRLAIEQTAADREAAKEASLRVESELRESLAEARARAAAAEQRATAAEVELAALRERLAGFSGVLGGPQKDTDATAAAEETPKVTDKKRRRWFGA